MEAAVARGSARELPATTNSRSNVRLDRRSCNAVTSPGILGVTIARHFLELEALTDVDHERIEAVAEPWFAALLG